MAYGFTSASSQYLSTTSAPVAAAPLTIACWFRTSGNNTEALVSIGKSGGTARFQIQTISGLLRAYTDNGAGATESIDGNNVSTNTWVHGAVAHSASNSRTLYKNGVSEKTGTTNIVMGSLDITLIAARSSTNIGGFFNGNIAEVGIWDTSLTAAEIASLADGMTCNNVCPQNLVFYAPLVRDLIDYSGKLTITNNNAATVANHPRVYA